MRLGRFLLGLAAAASAARADSGPVRAHLVVLSTTDLHGHIYPFDYYTNRPAEYGIAKTASLIARERIGAPEALLIDCGDTIQGSPLEYYHNRIDNSPPDPLILAMNALRYDAMAIGNHDYNYGLAVQNKARGEARFPWLSANTYETATGRNWAAPYIVKVIDGVRVGVLGLTTPGIPYWEDPKNYAGLEFRDPVAEARKWVPILRGRERCDVVILAMHMGLGKVLSTWEDSPGQVPGENAAIPIAAKVPGIDLILMGHTHQDVPSVVIHGVLLTQASLWGDHLARADLFLERRGDGPWTVVAKRAKTIPVTAQVEADPRILALAEKLHLETLAWLDRPIGDCGRELSAADARVRPNAVIGLVQRVQLEAGHADVSMASPFNLAAVIHPGPVRIRDIYSLYIYDNTLGVVEVTGAQLKQILEHAAANYRPYHPGATASDLVRSTVWPYNFDSVAGVSYDIDLARPAGDRIEHLRFHGAPLDPKARLRLAANNYRLNGGGGYDLFKTAPILLRSSDEVRNLIIEWVERHRHIPAEPLGRWRLVAGSIVLSDSDPGGR